MPKKFKELMNVNITHNGFTLYTRDACDVSTNISIIFQQKYGWFKKPLPMHIDEINFFVAKIMISNFY